MEAILNSMERLTADEIGNIIVNLQEDIALSNRILKKAVDNRVIFSTSSLTFFSFANNKKLVADAVRNSAKEFTSESLDELRGIIDDKLIREISQQQNIPLYDYGYAEESFDSNQGGFLFTLLSLFSGFNQKENSNHYKHNGRCNGDCAHCPDHYGYRYGRWYYGHNHTEGCEFGGNKGSGGSD